MAKALADESRSAVSSHSPTLTEAMTRPGVILGTAAYMSPEQAKGKVVDKRSDIWSLGCILYECLTGKRVFEGETVTETLGGILRAEPDWQQLPETTPPGVRMLLRRCLQKDPGRRFRDAGDVGIEIEEAPASSLPEGVAVHARAGWRPAILLGLALIAAIAAGTAGWILKPPLPGKVTRFSAALPEGQSFTNTGRHLLSISPDGASFVYVANQQLYLRRLSETESRPIPGTDQVPTSPFFSPDGQWVGFYSVRDGSLKKIAVTGGAVVTLCKASNPFGAGWQGDKIIFGQGSLGILAVSPSGGTPEVWFKPEPEEVSDSPQILPGGDALLFAVAKSSSSGGFDSERAVIVVYSRESGKRKVLVQGGSAPRYIQSGHIIYALGTNLLMVSFDLDRLEVTGVPVPILEGVMRAALNTTGAANYALSGDGTLVYIPSSNAPADTNLKVLALADRSGNRDVLGLPPGSYGYPRLSHDGRQLALTTSDDGGTIWVYDLSGNSALRRLTFEGSNSFPIWSPDGRRLAFYSNRENEPGIFLQAADGSGAAERLTNMPEAGSYILNWWSPDGKTLAFHADRGGDWGIWTVALTGDRKAELFMDVPGSIQGDAAFSPDGRWLAYISSESGTYQVYVQPFPKTGAARYQISREGSNYAPVWSPDGKELFYYQASSGKLMAVPIRTQPSFSFGQPIPLPIEGMIQPTARQYDIMPDGKRFLVLLPAADGGEQSRPVQQVNAVLNWFEELKRHGRSGSARRE